MLNLKYFIEMQRYYNEYGELKTTNYYIKYRVPFLFYWERWKYIKHRDCGWGDDTMVRTSFRTKEATEEYVTNILCEGKPVSKWSSSIIKEVTCSG